MNERIPAGLQYAQNSKRPNVGQARMERLFYVIPVLSY